jgi:putative MFS transporter
VDFFRSETDNITPKASLFSDPSHAIAFWGGSVAVTIGVLLHIPMFLMGRTTHFKLAGMPMGTGMLIGMGLIVAGFAATAYGLMPRRLSGILNSRKSHRLRTRP